MFRKSSLSSSPATLPEGAQTYLLEVCDFNAHRALKILRTWPTNVEVSHLGRNDEFPHQWQIRLISALSEYELDRTIRATPGIHYLGLRLAPELAGRRAA